MLTVRGAQKSSPHHPVPVNDIQCPLGFSGTAQEILHPEALDCYLGTTKNVEFQPPRPYTFRGNVLLLLDGNPKSCLVFIILKEPCLSRDCPCRFLR